MNSCW